MPTTRFFVLLLLLMPSGSLAQTCSPAASIPSGLKRLGTGSATAHYDSTTRVKGGQGVYIRIKNGNALGVSFELKVEEESVQPKLNCASKALVVPKGSVILYGATFADEPIDWRVHLAVAEESDAGVLTYEVFSLPQRQSRKAK